MTDQWIVRQHVYGCDEPDFDPRHVIEDVMRENADYVERYWFSCDVFVHTENEGYTCHKRHFTLIIHLGPERPRFQEA